MHTHKQTVIHTQNMILTTYIHTYIHSHKDVLHNYKPQTNKQKKNYFRSKIQKPVFFVEIGYNQE